VFRFDVTHAAEDSPARTGRLVTLHGEVKTPAFMPVGTRASVKGMTPPMLREAGAHIVLANTFHLAMRPGSERIRELGGLHRFMGWEGPILTDSGGFQVFSLTGLRKVSEEGIAFRSPVDGEKLFLSPERAVAIQEDLGVDVAMALDELVGSDAPRDAVEAATDRTTRWCRRCRDARTRDDMALFAIVQGGIYEDLRESSARDLAALDLPGYAAGGFSVGEDRDTFRRIASFTAPLLPRKKPRYLMGVGTPLDLVEASGWGYDLFDCVLPTRNARNGCLFTSRGTVSIKNAAHGKDPSPLDAACTCWGCRNVSRAYLNHLYRANDPTAVVLNTLHNLTFYLNLMARIREAIRTGTLPDLHTEVAAYHRAGPKDSPSNRPAGP
jgi:queuine tRNA-ribosyltransferase